MSAKGKRSILNMQCV